MHRTTALVGLFWIATLSPGFAAPREDALAGIERCRATSDDRRFLDCVYGAVQPLRAEFGLTPAPVFQTQLVPPAVGAQLPPPPPRGPMARANENENTSVTADGRHLFGSGYGTRLASYAFDKRGHFTVTLSDGSMWRQLDRDQALAHWSGRPPSYDVGLRSFKSDYYLAVKGDSGLYQVERLR